MGSIVEKRVNDFLVNEVVLFVFADQTQFVEFAQNFKHDSPSLPQTVAHRRNQQAVDYHALWMPDHLWIISSTISISKVSSKYPRTFNELASKSSVC